MVRAFTLLAGVLLAVTSSLPVQAVELALYHDNTCGAGSTGGGSADGEQWVNADRDTNSFEISGANGDTVCVFAVDSLEGCRYKKQQVKIDSECHKLTMGGDWVSFWVRSGPCPGPEYKGWC